MKKKILAVVLAVVILAVAAVGATLAWLMSTTQKITNTFTIGKVAITLTETDVDEDGVPGNQYQLIPGATYLKDPTITVAAKSEECYVFVKVEETGTEGNDALVYDIRTGTGAGEWTALDGVDGVYYQVVTKSESDTTLYVLTGSETNANGEISINGDLTNEDITNMGENTPELSFTAYAIQKANIETPADAWAEFFPAEPETTEAAAE